MYKMLQASNCYRDVYIKRYLGYMDEEELC